MNRHFFRLLFFLFLPLFTYANPQVIPLTLKEAETIFLERNLSLLAERYNIDMAQAELLQSRLWENPVISFEQNVYNRDTKRYFDMGREGQFILELEQPVPLSGEFRKRAKVERYNKEVAEHEFQELVREMRSELNTTFIELYFSMRCLQVYDQQTESLSELIASSKVQQAKGNISFMEATRLEAMFMLLKKEKNELENEIIELESELSMLLNLPAGYRFDLLLDEKMLEQVNLSAFTLGELSDRLNVRPDLLTTRSSLNASRADLRLQKALAYPEFSIQGVYDKVANFVPHYFAVGFSVSVPVFNRNQGNIKAARYKLLQAETELQLSAGRANQELYAAYSRLEKAVDLYNSINSELENNFALLLEGLNTNFSKKNISLLEFVDYYESYKELYLHLYSTRKEVFLAMENLNKVTGQNIINY